MNKKKSDTELLEHTSKELIDMWDRSEYPKFTDFLDGLETIEENKEEKL